MENVPAEEQCSNLLQFYEKILQDYFIRETIRTLPHLSPEAAELVATESTNLRNSFCNRAQKWLESQTITQQSIYFRKMK